MRELDREAVFAHCRARFGTGAEYLWARLPDAAALRNPESGRWYAVAQLVERAKLGLDGEGKLDILVIRAGPVLTAELLAQPGFLPGYHMNKANWVSVPLDGSAPPERLCPLLDIAYELAAKPRRP